MDKVTFDQIIEEYKKGNIVCSTCTGLMVYNIDEIINQDIDGLLYDINRDEATILALMDGDKWVNDYALTKVVRRMSKRIKDLESEIEKHK